MSDRASTSFTCAERHEADVLRLLRYDKPTDRHIEEPGIATLHFEELDYAGYTEMEEMKAQHIVFYGCHGSGSCYTAGVFCCDGRALARCNSDANCDGPVASVRENGTIGPYDAKEAARYWKVLKRTKEKLKAMAAEDSAKARSP